MELGDVARSRYQILTILNMIGQERYGACKSFGQSFKWPVLGIQMTWFDWSSTSYHQ